MTLAIPTLGRGLDAISGMDFSSGSVHRFDPWRVESFGLSAFGIGARNYFDYGSWGSMGAKAPIGNLRFSDNIDLASVKLPDWAAGWYDSQPLFKGLENYFNMPSFGDMMGKTFPAGTGG